MGSYFGSKATSGLCQAIIALMPPHDTYIETHLGGGAIMQRKPPALRNIGIERNARVLERFQCDYPVERIHGCAHRFLADYPFNGRELVYCDPPVDGGQNRRIFGEQCDRSPARVVKSGRRFVDAWCPRAGSGAAGGLSAGRSPEGDWTRSAHQRRGGV